MESFFELIAGNFFFVIIIVVAIINLFSKAKKATETTQNEDTKDPRQQKPTLQERIEEKVEQARESYQQVKDTIETETKERTKSVDEQRKEQYDQLRRRIQSDQHNSVGEHRVDVKTPKKQDESQPETEAISFEKHLEKNLTKQGLAESIVMAEVLGPPRALNPYQNVAVRRRSK